MSGYFNLEKLYQFKLRSMPRGANYKDGVTNNSCNAPHRVVVVDWKSNCFICIADGFLPIPVGQVSDFNSIDDVWNSETAKVIQKDIADKKFTWCAVDQCSIRKKDININPAQLHLNIDESCNLSCPSCRRETIMHTSGELVERKTKDVERVLSWLDQYKDPIHIVFSGNGDPLASTIIRPLVRNFTPKENHTFTLHTNGLLIKKQLDDSKIFPNITVFSISTDAGSKPVYEKVRRGGSWEVLIENLEYLVAKGKAPMTRLNFVLQNDNYADLDNFVALAEKYQFRCDIGELTNWGTWNTQKVIEPDAYTIANGTFVDHNILDPKHPNHNACREVLRRHLNKPRVIIGPRILQTFGLA